MGMGRRGERDERPTSNTGKGPTGRRGDGESDQYSVIGNQLPGLPAF